MARLGILIAVLAITVISCSSPKFYKEIKNTRIELEAYTNESMTDGKKFAKHVLKRIENKLQNSDHIIYYFISPDSQNCNQPYAAIVTDIDNNIDYYLKRNIDNTLSIDTLNNSTNTYYKYILDNYKERNLTYLLSTGELTILNTNKFGYECIYEVDLKSDKAYFFGFISINFHNGKPDNEVVPK